MEPGWQEVLDARIELLNWAIDQIRDAGVRDAMDRMTSVLRRETGAQNSRWGPLLVHMRKLAGYGLRDLMVFLQNYSWLEGRVIKNSPEEHPINRLMEQYPVGLIAFMLQGKRLFSQLHSRTPNLYVVNNHCKQLESGAHPHSYWLKRLLLTYIYQRAPNAVWPEHTIKIFTQNGHGYSESLVRACLGSISMANASCLVQIVRSPVRDGELVRITNLTITARGQHFLTAICDRLFYLQLIVDDFMLPLPNSMESLCRFEDDMLDYTHLVAPFDEYIRRAKALIPERAMWARSFLIVLDEALKMERAVYAKVFQALSEEDVVLPDMRQIISGFDDELRRIGGQFSSGSWIEQVREGSEKRRPSIIEDLKNCYLQEQYQ